MSFFSVAPMKMPRLGAKLGQATEPIVFVLIKYKEEMLLECLDGIAIW